VPSRGRATRIAVIGDVHANDERLAAALERIDALQVDVVACTGDIIDGHGSVERCCALLRAHNVLCVRGNHDRWLFTGLLRDRVGATVRDRLSGEDQEFLQSLPSVRELATSGGTILVCHGIGRFDLERITRYETDYSLRVNRSLQEIIRSGKYRVMVNGHTHDRLVLRVGELAIVNAGALHLEDPGFVLIDVGRNVVQWHSLGASTVVEEQPLLP
jgi:putative phosphoesterase